MTYQQFIEQLPTMERTKENAELIERVCNSLSILSQGTLAKFQQNWQPKDKTFKDFVKAQNNELIKCLKLEGITNLTNLSTDIP